MVEILDIFLRCGRIIEAAENYIGFGSCNLAKYQ